MPRGTRGAVWFVTRRLRPRPAPQTLAPLAPARSDAQIVSCSERPSGAKGAPAVPSADGTEQIEGDRAVILVQPFKLPAKVRPAPVFKTEPRLTAAHRARLTHCEDALRVPLLYAKLRAAWRLHQEQTAPENRRF